jgi:hypothetical protein
MSAAPTTAALSRLSSQASEGLPVSSQQSGLQGTALHLMEHRSIDPHAKEKGFLHHDLLEVQPNMLKLIDMQTVTPLSIPTR